MKLMTFSAFMFVAIDCAEKAVGVTAQTIFVQDNVWLWWLPAVGWAVCGIYAVAGAKA